MISAIGGILPLALGVALSPIPIIAVIVMLMAKNARTLATGFLVGWVAINLVIIAGLTALSSVLPEADADGSNPTVGIILLVLGLVMLLLAIGQWRQRPGPGETAPEPEWMKAIDTFTFGKAAGMGLAIGLVNPKNIVLAAGAATSIAGSGLGTADDIIIVVVFALVATSTVYLPVIGYLLAAERLRKPLESLRTWLTQENATIMFLLFLVLGVSMVSKGLQAL